MKLVAAKSILKANDQLAAENRQRFDAAGVFCVGMGSHLVDAETLKAGRFAELTDRARRLVAILAVR